jgi:hypothetical protein
VFVSYARTDRRAVERAAQELVAAGHETWIDVDDIQPGESWRRSIVRSIAQSDAVVVFLSPSSATSTRDPLSRLDAIVFVDEDAPDLPTTLGP